MWFDSYKLKEISQLLYISEATVKRIIHYYQLWNCVKNPFKRTWGRKKIFNNNDMNVSILSIIYYKYATIVTNTLYKDFDTIDKWKERLVFERTCYRNG